MFSLPLPPCPGVCWLPQRPSSTATFSDVFSASSSMSWSLLASSAAFFHRDLLGFCLCLFLHVLEFVGFLSGLLPLCRLLGIFHCFFGLLFLLLSLFLLFLSFLHE